MNLSITQRHRLLITLSLALVSCTSLQSGSNKLKGEIVQPAPDAGFIQHPERQTQRADLPFQKIWIKPGIDKSRYREIYVAPVNTQYMLDMDWMHKSSGANWLSDVKQDIENLAEYFQQQVVKAFKNDPQHRFKVIDSPAESKHRALRIELALIEIDPSEPVLHALGWMVPGGGTAAGIVNQRRAAFEGRLRDGKTNEVLATFADRDMQDAGPIDLTRLTWYGPAKGIMDRWAQQFVQILNRKPGEAVTDPTAVTLRPF